ncbi:hemagglutinin protein [Bizionia arctica]|uniref:Dockerin domain-containing protein n=1 Tax=Bizionia arctica TaxID=1495645 RepID=A0A917GFW6_9FLAO|nr:hemagglutinin protein [Bizionia arctica]GGG44469.1 hypothetical protein GCM10010976_15080 [Bizionia arctica]
MKTILSILVIFCFTKWSNAQTIEKFSIDSGGASVTAGGIEILYTIGEVNVQELSSGNIQVSEGFINPITLMIKLDPKIFLEGPYATSLMNDDLRIAGIIPTSSPYIDNVTCNASVFNTTGTNAVIDWVWIEIRDSADGITVITEKSALLLANGSVVATDGVSTVPIDVPIGNYYVMVSHRNHLGILTANTVNLSGGTTVLDLTSNSNLIMGGSNGIANMGDGKFALYAGDFNGDGNIQNTDRNAVEPLRGLTGYNNADMNLDGEVQNVDINNFLNPNLGKGEQFTSNRLYAKRKTN